MRRSRRRPLPRSALSGCPSLRRLCALDLRRPGSIPRLLHGVPARCAGGLRTATDLWLGPLQRGVQGADDAVRTRNDRDRRTAARAIRRLTGTALVRALALGALA